MKLELHLDMDDAAFDNGPGPLEATRLLRAVAQRIDAGDWVVDTAYLVRDAAGSVVGNFALVAN